MVQACIWPSCLFVIVIIITCRLYVQATSFDGVFLLVAFHYMYIAQGSFPVRKRTGTLRIWRARVREPIWGSGGGTPGRVQGQSPWSGRQSPPEAEGILLPKRANLSLSFK